MVKATDSRHSAAAALFVCVYSVNFPVSPLFLSSHEQQQPLISRYRYSLPLRARHFSALLSPPRNSGPRRLLVCV